MECFIASPEDISAEGIQLRGDEAHHALRSLRLRPGDELLVTDLAGTSYRCELVEAMERGSVAQCRVLDRLTEFGEPLRKVRLIQGMISQPARWEFLLEKATELGVTAIQPVTTERTEREHFKADRSDRILRAAVKQTKRSRLPELRLLSTTQQNSDSASPKGSTSELSTLSAALSEAVQAKSRLFLLHEAASPEQGLHRLAAGLAPDSPITIAVGPEGGFSDEEVHTAQTEFGAEIVSLGARRLRAETAAIAALAILIDR